MKQKTVLTGISTTGTPIWEIMPAQFALQLS